MTDTPKRLRGRPRKHATPAAREAASRTARGAVTLQLPRTVLDALDALAARHGDPNRPACIARLVREAE